MMIDRGLDLNPKKLATTRLGGGLTLTGRIDDLAFADSLKAVTDFCAEARAAGAEPYAFATEAVRAAANGRAFCNAVAAATGVRVDVLTGKQEAMIAYLGAGDPTGRCTVIDSGGASTEITSGSDGVITDSVSIKTGAVRLKSMGLNVEATRAYIDGKLYEMPRLHKKIVIIGGTATALASADLRLKQYDAQKVHGHTLTYEALNDLIAAFEQGHITEQFPAVTRARAEIILYGALIYERIMAGFRIHSVTVSESDNCEGYLRYLDKKQTAV